MSILIFGIKPHSVSFFAQVAAAAAAASSMLSKAVAISAAVEAEGQLQQVQASLRDQEEQANDAVKVFSHSCSRCCTPLLPTTYQVYGVS